MPTKSYISQIVMPSGTTYDIKDAEAREQIEALLRGTEYLGVTTTALVDDVTTSPVVTISGESVTAKRGDIVTYQSKEFIYNGTVWQEFGDLSALGALAHKDSASGSYTPAGSVSAPAVSVATAGATATVHNPSAVTVAKTVVAMAPSQSQHPDNALTYYDVTNETLTLYQLGYTTGASIDTSDVTVKTGDATYEASAPTFSGSAATVTVS